MRTRLGAREAASERSLAVAPVLARGIDVQNCGCVSVAKQAADAAWPPAWMRGVGWYLVTRNLVLLGAALTLVTIAPGTVVRQSAT